MKEYIFNSSIVERGSFEHNFPQEIIKNEIMFFNCDLDFAYSKGKSLTRNFIDSLPEDWKNCNPVLDSRVHMLMPGWFPCIPGYHHDDVPRNTSTGQPNYVNPDYHSQHLMGLVNGEIYPTLFAIGQHFLPEIDSDIIYKKWHPIVEAQLQTGILVKKEIDSGIYIEFDWQSMHTGQRAVKGGWRWFVRLSRNTTRQINITNELRNQVQVYLEFPMEGW